jgi:hypothetical protein
VALRFVMADLSRNRRSNIGGRGILLIDSFQPTRNARAAVLRMHGIDADTAENLHEARLLCQAGTYNLVLIDVRRYREKRSISAASRERLSWPADCLSAWAAAVSLARVAERN